MEDFKRDGGRIAFWCKSWEDGNEKVEFFKEEAVTGPLSETIDIDPEMWKDGFGEASCRAAKGAAWKGKSAFADKYLKKN